MTFPPKSPNGAAKAHVGQRRAADDRRVQRSQTSVDVEENIRPCTLHSFCAATITQSDHLATELTGKKPWNGISTHTEAKILQHLTPERSSKITVVGNLLLSDLMSGSSGDQRGDNIKVVSRFWLV